MIAYLAPPYSAKFKLAAYATLAVVFFMAGWTVHGWKTDAGIARTITKAEKTRQTAQDKVVAVVQKAQINQAATKIIYRSIRERINEKNDNRVCFDDAESLQLWNRSIAGADQYRSEPARASDQIGTAENAAAIATVEQVLTNAAENFQICNENAIKHNALIDSIEVYTGKMCVCSN